MSDKATRDLHELMPLGGLMGMQLVEQSRRRMVLALDWDQRTTTAGELMHGGAIMALADSAGGALAFANLPDGATGTATIESKTNFFGAVRGGRLTATATLLHKGRRTIVVETELRTDDDRLVAKTTQTQAVL